MQPTTFWTIPKKIVITIILAVIAWALFGCSSPIPETPIIGETNVAFLQETYKAYNEAYFDGKLPKDTTFTVDLDAVKMADSGCEVDGTQCIIRFNLRYTRAQRVAQGVLLHEMCHVKLWKVHTEIDGLNDKQLVEYYHDKSWRACMLNADANGAFREINIDFYREH